MIDFDVVHQHSKDDLARATPSAAVLRSRQAWHERHLRDRPQPGVTAAITCIYCIFHAREGQTFTLAPIASLRSAYTP